MKSKSSHRGRTLRSGSRWIRAAADDLRYAARMLRRSPGFTLVAVLILALGIGANTAVFSLFSAVLLRPLPFEGPDRLVVLWDDLTSIGGASDVAPTPANFVEWKTRAHSFQDLALMEKRTYDLTGGGEPEKLNGVRTTANLFSLLGLEPILGRTFSAEDEGPDAVPVVVVSESLWMRRFGGDRALVGRTIVLDGVKRMVVGVVPNDFQFPRSPDGYNTVWVPASFTPAELAQQARYTMYVVARLRSGVSLSQARADVTTIAQTLVQEHRADKGFDFAVVPLHSQLSNDIRPALFILLGAVGVVLLITCANVANLLLARGASRQKEFALRQALGAGQGRMAAQLLTESALLAALGVIVGVVLSTTSFGYLTHLIPATFPQGTHPALDWRVLAFTAGLTLLTILLFGTGPALAGARLGFNEALKNGEPGRSLGSAVGPRVRNGLVVAEISLTVVLLVGAGLLLRSYAAVLAVNPGFQPEQLLIAKTDLPPSKYGAFADRKSFYEGVLARVDALPGVSSAGYASYPPLAFKGGRVLVSIEGRPPPRREEVMRYAPVDRVVSAKYFSTLGVPLIRGRPFDDRDTPGSARVVLVNQTMARRYWPGQDPIGKRFRLGGGDSAFPWLTVIGVVGDVKEMGLDAAVEPVFYSALGQSESASTFQWPKYLVVRTQLDPTALTNPVRKAVWDVDPEQPVSNIEPMTELFDRELASRRMQLALVGGLASLALLLASVGLYSVLAYMVVRRTSEIGLRAALGAQRVTIVGSIVRRALLLAACGIAIGVAGAFSLSRVLSSFLYGISPADPITYVAVPALVVIVVSVASYVPASRAAGVDPIEALRVE